MTDEFNQQQQYTMLVKQAKKYMNDQSIDQAISRLMAAYKIRQTSEINHLIVTLLIAQGQYQEAQLYADEYVETYTNEQKDVELYLNLTLHNQYFLVAREFLTNLSIDKQPHFKQKIIDSEEIYRLKQQKTMATIARQFYHLGDGNMAEQQKTLLLANKLPLTEYLTGAKFVLQDPFLAQISRTTVLDQLRKLAIAEEVVMLNLDGKLKTYVPVDLLALEKSNIYQNIVNKLYDQAKQIGSDMVYGLIEQARLMLMMAYPDLDLVVKDIDSWVAGLIATTFGNPMPSEPQNQADWRNKLQNKLLESFSEQKN